MTSKLCRYCKFTPVCWRWKSR